MSSELTKKDRGWLLPDCRNQQIKPGLYLIATPIGNLGDITVRALDMLVRADLVVCEDTRVTGKMFKSYGIDQKLALYNDHSSDKDREKILNALKDGKLVALVSDAGMPLVSDPGYRLVQDCIAQNIYVTSLPGANAPLMALQLSGLASDKFVFQGFLPPKKVARQKMLQLLSSIPITLIFFEAPQRLADTLADMAEIWGDRQAAVGRELTKLYEDVRRGSLEDLKNFYTDQDVKGEIVIVIEGLKDSGKICDEDLQNLLAEALKTMKTKDAVRAVSEKTGLPGAMLYDMALKIK